MTIIRYILIIAVALTVMCGCIEEPALGITSEKQLKVTVSIRKTTFPEEYSSRSNKSEEWENGDQLFLRFKKGSTFIIGIATYDKGANFWYIERSEDIPVATNGNVEVYYFQNNNETELSISKISLTPYTPIYGAVNGRFTLNEQNELTISATIKPLTSRIYFRGADNTTINVGGIDFISTFNLRTGEFEYDRSCVQLTTLNNGETLYIYGVHNQADRKIIVSYNEDDDYCSYTFSCSGDKFTVGRSGWLTIPEKDKCENWTRKQLTGITNNHQWVDLGLPSGTKWSIENIGANYSRWILYSEISDIYGSWYSWGSTKSDGCHYVQISDFTDVSKYEWGNNWRVASTEDYYELYTNCKWEWLENYQNKNVNGCLLTSLKYGNSIFFPAAGNWHNNTGGEGDRQDDGEAGWYYTSSYSDDGNMGCCTFYPSGPRAWNFAYRAHRFSIRAVCSY